MGEPVSRARFHVEMPQASGVISRMLLNRRAAAALGDARPFLAAFEPRLERLRAALDEFLRGARPDALELAMTIRGADYEDDKHPDTMADVTAGEVSISRAGIHLLRRLGVEPRAVAALGVMHGLGAMRFIAGGTPVAAVMRIPQDTGVTLTSRGWRVDLEAELAPGIRWLPDLGSLEIAAPMSSAIRAALVGQPLEALVDHPATRGLGATLASAREIDGETHVEVDVARGLVDMARLERETGS